MKTLPNEPSLTKAGNYDPGELLTYLDRCRMDGISVEDISKQLRIPVSRAIYAIGDGYVFLRRRAKNLV